MQLRSSASLVMLAVLAALPSAVQAQGREVDRLPVPTPPAPVAAAMGRAQPGVASSSPLGFGASRNDAFAGVGYQNRIPNGADADGAVSVGVGLLSPDEIVGLEFVVTSLSTVRSGFGSRMVGGLKAHKRLANGVGIGLGMEGFRLAGDEFDTKDSYYVVATQVRSLREAATFNQLTINGGLGTGRFQSASSFASGKSSIGVFASAGLRVNEYANAILDFTGAQLNAALSFTPSAKYPIVITPALNDLTGAAGDAGRLSIGAGLSWKY